ncbi:MAG: hypothetical protein RLZZ243_441 [Bacteroidota bacterium]
MTHLIDQVAQLVEAKFKDQEGSHDWFHIERVWKTALYLQSKEGGNADEISLAALLHDYSDHKYNGGDFDAGSREVLNLLNQLNCPFEIADRVAKIVQVVSYKGALVSDEATSIEGRIVRDADRLDAIGAIGIARAFSYGGSKERPLYDPSIAPLLHATKEEYSKSKSHTINHFYEKLLLLKDRMETATARQLAEERHQFMLDFLKQFDQEWGIR